MSKTHAPMNKPRTPSPSLEYQDGWDRIFGKDKKKEAKPKKKN